MTPGSGGDPPRGRRLPLVPERPTEASADPLPPGMPVRLPAPTLVVVDLVGDAARASPIADSVATALRRRGLRVARLEGGGTGALRLSVPGSVDAVVALGGPAALGVAADLLVTTGLGVPPTAWLRALRGLPAADLRLAGPRPGLGEGLAGLYPWRWTTPRPITPP